MSAVPWYYSDPDPRDIPLKAKYRRYPKGMIFGNSPAGSGNYGGTKHEGAITREEIARRERDRKIQADNRMVKVLDFTTSSGGKIRWFKKADWDKYGTELLK